jgi:hypothetical protein
MRIGENKMGLDIKTCNEEIESYNGSYHNLHEIREIAIKICGYKKDIGEWYKEFEDKHDYGVYNRFRQLLHFSDCEGILVRGFFLEEVDYSKSYELGNSDTLLKELEDMKEEIERNPKLIKENWIKEVFDILYNQVKDEVENCCGLIQFC